MSARSATPCAAPGCVNDAYVTSLSQPVCDHCWAEIVKLVPGHTRWHPTPLEQSPTFSIAMDAFFETRGRS